MTKEEMLLNLEQNQYQSGGTTTMNAAYFLFGNPLTDSAVVNAFAKTNSAAFEFALKTGSAYGNNTIMGGNFLYNSLYNFNFFGKKLNLIRNINSASFNIGKGFNFNFISSGEFEKDAGKFMTDVADITGLDKGSDIIRSGWGIGRNYNDFIKSLNRTSYDLGDLSQTYNQYKNFKGNPKSVAKAIKRFSDADYQDFLKYVGTDDLKTVGQLRIGARPKVKKNIIDAFDKYVSEAKNIGIADWNSTNLSNSLRQHLTKISAESPNEIKKIADAFLKTGKKLNSYQGGKVTKEVIEEIAEKAGTMFASRSTFEKIISSPFMRLATGAAISLPASVAIPFTVATTAIGTTASVGQEQAINNFINASLYNINDYDSYVSDESISSIYSASQIRDYNLQILTEAYSKVNTAERYLNDMDDISLDNNKFELEDVEVI